MKNYKYNNGLGYSLIEMSVVLVIIGLIVSGVLGGRALIQQIKLKSVVSDYNQYVTAFNTFRVRYNALPGDIANASAHGLGFNGNGDGKIFHENSEILYAWQHLGEANIISGSYTGDDAGEPDDQIGVNLPAMSFGESVTAIYAYLSPVYLSNVGGDSCIGVYDKPLFGIHQNFNVLSFGKLETISDNCPVLPFLTVKEAYGMDSKIDDGLADSGDMFSANKDNTNNDGDRCVDNNVQGTGGANYDFDENGVTCRIIFRLD